MKPIAFFLTALFLFQFGTAKAQILDSVKVYPNPFESNTIVQFSLTEQDTISISFLNGGGAVALQPMVNQILAGGIHTININTQTLPFGIYFIRIDCGSGGYKIKKGIKGNVATSNNSSTISKTLVLFPNPTSDLLFISPEGTKEIRVSNMSGKDLMRFKTNLNQVSLRNLPNGIYNIQVLDEFKKLMLRENVLKVD